MISKNTEQFIAEANRHVAMDLVEKGHYIKTAHGRACFIGCHAGGNNPEVLQGRYGFPLALTRICEGIFEDLPHNLGIVFHAAIPAAVGVDGKDLSLVHWAFLAAELRALPPQGKEIQAVIDPVIAGIDLLASRKDWPQSTARAAADAADAADAAYAAHAAHAADAAHAACTAAYAAAYAAYAAYTAAHAADAAHAAYAAAYAARAARAARAAARIRQRDTILHLIAGAPVQAAS